MSSIANRSGGGIKLLDTVEATSATNKPLNYFENIGALDYDVLLVDCVNGTDHTQMMIPQDLLVESKNTNLCFVVTIDPSNRYFGKINSYTQYNYYIFGGGITYKIYGIRL